MAYRKAAITLYSVLTLYALLVASHEGEFWPFSIYPMFSQSGNEWSKSLVAEIENERMVIDWKPRTISDLHGDVLPLNRIGLNQNDLAEILTRTERWSDARIAHVRQFFGDLLQEQAFVVYMARPELKGKGRGNLHVAYTPWLYFYPDSTYVNPMSKRP